MKAMGHIATGASVLALMLALQPDSVPGLGPWLPSSGGDAIQMALGCTVGLVGAVLPDIDTRGSMAARAQGSPIPVAHRTLTHGLWIPLILLLLGRLIPCIWWASWLAIGLLTHILADGLSPAGVPWMWPLSRKRRGIALYRTGRWSERMVVWAVVALTLMALVAAPLAGAATEKPPAELGPRTVCILVLLGIAVACASRVKVRHRRR